MTTSFSISLDEVRDKAAPDAVGLKDRPGSFLGRAGTDKLIDEEAWLDLVEWLRVYGSIDPDLLAVRVRAYLADDPSAQNLKAQEAFDLMVIRLALFDAALVNARRRADFQALMNQIQQHFSHLWKDLHRELKSEGARRLVDKAQELCLNETYHRKPDAVIDTFRPMLVGVESFLDLLGPVQSDPSTEGQEAVGPALYRTTLRASSSALMMAASLQTSLARAVEEDKESRRAEVEARANATPEGATPEGDAPDAAACKPESLA